MPANKVSKSSASDELTQKIISLCQRRAILFANSDIYGQAAGFFDYGPYGCEMKKRIEDSWWKAFVQSREDIVGIDGAIITSPAVWVASGHVAAFNDPLVECGKCKSRHRADALVEDELKISVDGLSLEKLGELIGQHRIVCPKCKGGLSVAKKFNLMFSTHIGAVQDETSVAYLRPETAQLMFADFRIVQQAMRKRLPFGMAQIGKAFRNEIAPRNFVFRCREFSQMEIEFFIHPKQLNDCPLLTTELAEKKVQMLTAGEQEKGKDGRMETVSIGDALDKKIIKTQWHAYWLIACLEWLYSLGINPQNLRLREHVKAELSHYSVETWDIEYEYPWGWKELQGIANRTDFDLSQHQKESGKDLSYFDEETRERVMPHVIEPSIGVDRLLFTVLLDAYRENAGDKGSTSTLALHPDIAPVQVAVFPLMKKDGLAERARAVFEVLRDEFVCEYDESGSIGKRYARQDEVGTPFCITIDYETLEKDDVTIRERDSGNQKRVPVRQLKETIECAFGEHCGLGRPCKKV
jgi:glycyl-tRNA synthetase